MKRKNTIKSCIRTISCLALLFVVIGFFMPLNSVHCSETCKNGNYSEWGGIAGGIMGGTSGAAIMSGHPVIGAILGVFGCIASSVGKLIEKTSTREWTEYPTGFEYATNNDIVLAIILHLSFVTCLLTVCLALWNMLQKRRVPQIIVNILAVAAIVCGMPMCYFILAQGTKTQNTIEIGGIILMLGYFISLAAGIISYFLKDRDIAASTTG